MLKSAKLYKNENLMAAEIKVYKDLYSRLLIIFYSSCENLSH